MLNRWVLSRGWKTVTEGAEVTRSGRLFQTRAAATGKAWSPTVGSRVWLTISDEDELERICCTAWTWGMNGVVYQVPGCLMWGNVCAASWTVWLLYSRCTSRFSWLQGWHCGWLYSRCRSHHSHHCVCILQVQLFCIQPKVRLANVSRHLVAEIIRILVWRGLELPLNCCLLAPDSHVCNIMIKCCVPDDCCLLVVVMA